MQKVTYRRCGGSSHTPVGGVTREWFTSLIVWSLWKYLYARFRYIPHTHTRKTPATVTWTERKATSAHLQIAPWWGEQLLHAPCRICNTAVLHFSSCLSITPPCHNQSVFHSWPQYNLGNCKFIREHYYKLQSFMIIMLCSVAYMQSTVEGAQYSITPSLPSNLLMILLLVGTSTNVFHIQFLVDWHLTSTEAKSTVWCYLVLFFEIG